MVASKLSPIGVTRAQYGHSLYRLLRSGHEDRLRQANGRPFGPCEVQIDANAPTSQRPGDSFGRPGSREWIDNEVFGVGVKLYQPPGDLLGERRRMP